MDVLKLRKIGRVSTGMGSLAVIIGGVLTATGLRWVGDGIMIAGFVVLLCGVAILVRSPTGDKDVG